MEFKTYFVVFSYILLQIESQRTPTVFGPAVKKIGQELGIGKKKKQP